jgi:hypothetical protein
MYFKDKEDIHELLKKELNIRPTITTHNDNEMEQFVVLDSFAKIKTSSTEKGEYQWIFNVQGLSSDEQLGILNVIDNVYEIQIGSFYMPILEDINYIDEKFIKFSDVTLIKNNTTPPLESVLPPTLIRNSYTYGQYPHSILQPDENYKIPWSNNPYSQTPFCNRITVYIKEANLQSYCNVNNTRYNYEFISMYDTRLHNNPNFMQVQPINGSKWDTFRFNTPLRHMESITLVFRNPDQSIQFEPDIMYKSLINMIDINDPFNGGLVHITTQFLHKLNSGDRIYLKNFRPLKADSTFNDEFPVHITNYILRPEGHVVNNIIPDIALDPALPLTDGFTFGLDPALKLINPLPSTLISFPSTIDVFIAKRRLRIPLRIRSYNN